MAVEAMNTRFELVLVGPDEHLLRSAGEEAVAEIEACESRLSLFRPGSLLALINRDAASRAVGVDRETFELLAEAVRLHRVTHGAFDPTVAPLMRAWRLHDASSSAAAHESLAAARRCVGMHLVELDPDACTVRFHVPGVSIDLGGLAKGHALELAARALRECGVNGDSGTAALLHAGTSSVLGIGAPPPPALSAAPHTSPDARGWNIALASPSSTSLDPASTRHHSRVIITLRDAALSTSAPRGRSAAVTDAQGRERLITHILDPRTGEPCLATPIAAAVSASATEAEGVSTALIVLGERPDGLDDACTTILPPLAGGSNAAAPTRSDPDWRIVGSRTGYVSVS